MKTVKDFDFKNKRVLVRCDFNVPLDKQENILDDLRIKAIIPTVKYLLKKGAKIILMGHLGRPDGKVVEELRLDPIAVRLSELLFLSVKKLEDCVGKIVETEIEKMKPGEAILLENVQFHPGERKNDLEFAKTLAGYADIFIMEAFGQAHRDYASIASISKYIPSGAGILLEREINNLEKLLEDPSRPLVAIVGGKKVKTKTKLIDKISENADFVLIGGLIQKELEEKNIKLKYPEKIIKPVDKIGGGQDIGPETIKLFQEKISLAKTIFWNGPLGRIEEKSFSKGTEEIAKAIAQSRAFSVAGGRETVEFIGKLDLTSKFTHVSTGGGAMLTFLSGEKLPGIEALK
ncbi:MAG TPA: phosphoglycerate kinase [Candidatus Nealsonbacteria bacterium]|uniref:phosphoglycerate kinase n=1 Tax=marine sediment metagenome TaxID=412755 RepID=A0A0F9U2X4_9ZZZZ|nr:phosphoglycerate kinase [Candidatus Nealsonbacteria bacterium]HEB46632.1 phosphoglycerate kinase [Candidatus Nealsonbacteria bacterium]